MNQLSENVKALFFAQYIGQQVEYNYNEYEGITLIGNHRAVGTSDGVSTANPPFVSIDSHDYYADMATDSPSLLLRKVEQLTDEEAIQIAQFAHQMPNGNFEVKRNNDIIHVQLTNHVGITYHISIYKNYGTVNANVHFSETKTKKFISYKANIGETSLSAALPVPYIAICDYLRAKGFLLPFTFLHNGKPQTLTPEQIVEMRWVRIKT